MSTTTSNKKLAFLLDDGWVLEKRETAKALAETLPVDILTHDQLTYDALCDEFEVILLKRKKLSGLKALVVMFFAHDLDTSLARTDRKRRLREKKGLVKLGYRLRNVLGEIGLRPYSVHKAFGFLYKSSNEYGELLDDYHTIIYNTVSIHDKRILYEARNRGVARLGWVYSWDNPVKDNEFIPDAEHYYVWNEFTKQDLKEVYQIPAEKVSITGPVQFEYLKKMRGVRPDDLEPFVLFACACAPDVYVEQEIDLVLLVRKMLDEIAPAMALHVRPYPFRNAKDTQKYTRLDQQAGVKMLYFGKEVNGTIVPDDKDREEKREQFEQSSCYINVGSTIGLEASFGNAPILQIAFSVDGPFREILDLSEQFKNEHLKYLIDDHFPNTCRDAESLKRGLGQILVDGSLESFQPYTEHLQAFANPIAEPSFVDCFCRQVKGFVDTPMAL